MPNFNFCCELQIVFIQDFTFSDEKKKQNTALEAQNLKLPNFRSAARAVRLSGSTHGLLPLRFIVVFDVLNLRAGLLFCWRID
jgi:hypothetical protein